MIEPPTKFSNLPQFIAVSIKNLILISFGMTLAYPTILISSLQEDQDLSNKAEEFYLSKSEISWISSINLIFVPLGCIVSGSFSSLLGRKRAMQTVCVPLFASWIIIYFARNVTYLYVALALSGITGGMLEAPVLTYVAEITTPEVRGLLAASGSFCIILGVSLQFLMGNFIEWRTIALISPATPIIAIFCLFFVPESPYWLIIKNRKEDAKKSLMWLRGWLKDFEPVKQEFNQIDKSLKLSEEKPQTLITSFTKRSFVMPYLICSFAFLVGHYSGMTTLQTYSALIFAKLQAPIDKNTNIMLLGIVELCGTAACVLLVKFVGKRKLTFVSLLGCSFCFFSTAIYSLLIDGFFGRQITHRDSVSDSAFHLDNYTTLAFNDTNGTLHYSHLMAASNEVNESEFRAIDENSYSWIPLTLMLSSAFLSHCGIRLLPWMLVGEIYPSKIRGVASGLTGGTSYVFGFSANKLFLTMQSNLTLPGTFIFNSMVSLIGCIVLFFVLPETEGRTLQEIEDHFSGVKKLTRSMKTHKTKSRRDSSLAAAYCNQVELEENKSTSPPPPATPVKFDLSHWDSNNKFEVYLKEHHLEPMKLNPIKNHIEHRIVTHEKRNHLHRHHDDKNGISTLSNQDYDTPL